MEQEREEWCVRLDLWPVSGVLWGLGWGCSVSQRTQQAEAVAHPRDAVGEGTFSATAKHSSTPHPPIWRGPKPPL